MKRLWKLHPSTKLCVDYYVFDTETAKRQKGNVLNWCLDGDFIFGVLYGYQYEMVIFSKEHFIEVLKEERFRNKKIFAHNAEFDLNVLYDCIFDLDPEAIFNGKFITCTNGVCIFADSGNIFVGRSVKDIGKMLKLEKQTLGENSKSIGITQKDIAYCIRDCEIIYKALFNVFEFAGDIKITQASLSLTYYRRFKQPFHIDHNENCRFFFDSYYGGRTEAFIKRKTHAKCIDVNSMYPYAMRECVFPNPKYLKVEHDISLFKFKKYLEYYEGCFYGTVEHDKYYLGLLPVKENEKLLFPVGTFSGCWNFNEIRFALSTGLVKIKKVTRVVYAERMESPFKDFVNDLNQLKIIAEIQGNEFERDRNKRLSNSLYGKLAQRIDEETIYIRDYVKQWPEIVESQINGTFKNLVTFNTKRKDAFLVIKSGKSLDISYSIPSFSSYITSFGRVMLLEKMIAMKENKIVYCDTDSLFFEIDNGNIESESQLGGWKVENKIITEIKGLKNYKYIDADKEVWRIKGVPVNKGRFTKIITGETEMEVPTVEQTSDTSFRYYNILKSKEALRRGKNPREITERNKEIKSTYDKRIVLANGETEPITL